ncbi:hypothetical protein [Bacillus sp. OK048]|uniref:hypothetical protein n=1 Tax=Bacillus sp. OK048 TaxID=1882761 RepID=UPI00087FA82E|nr:hypothetical protein [Bacillus sp. OK048]SDN52986.1 hypothetical protein SAMN05443253_11380 [Bacillus sp. OK048]
MGINCSCGVSSKTVVIINLKTTDCRRNGPLTITVDACANRLALSTVSATFVDQSGRTPNRRFSFSSTSIQVVSCTKENTSCIVRLAGMGLVSGETTPRQFIIAFRNNPDPAIDQLIRFSITDFVDLTRIANLHPDLTFIGCL